MSKEQTFNEKMKQWRKLADAATDGPWESRRGERHTHAMVVNPSRHLDITIDCIRKEEFSNAEFIAAAREAVPALLDRVAELEMLLSEQRGEKSDVEQMYYCVRSQLASAIGICSNADGSPPSMTFILDSIRAIRSQLAGRTGIRLNHFQIFSEERVSPVMLTIDGEPVPSSTWVRGGPVSPINKDFGGEDENG